MRLVVIAPHFAPDVAPTGVVVTRIVEELAARGHRMGVVTSLPWYREHRVERPWAGRLVRHEDVPWGRITRLHPWPSPTKRDLVRRAAAFAGFSVAAALFGVRATRPGAWREPRADAVLALSPPLTLGLAGWAVSRSRPWPDGRHVPFVFNVQDVFPDVAIDLGMLTHPGLVAAARGLERVCYARADAITVLSEDLRDNVATRVSDPAKVRVIHNFVDTEAIRPLERDNGYRREHGLEGRFVIMYAGNVGLSQSLELLLESARALADDQRVAFVINGQGAARAELERKARGLDNVRFVDLQPPERVPELLAAADVHVVPLKRGLTRSSVPSKALSVLAAGRPLVASVDPGSELARLCERSGAGVAVPPEDVEAFTAVLRRLVDAPDEARRMGEAGRAYAQTWASPEAVARRYEELLAELLDARRPAP